MDFTQAYTSQIVAMAMLALAIGGDTISTQERREAIIAGLVELPSMSLLKFFFCFICLACYSSILSYILLKKGNRGAE